MVFHAYNSPVISHYFNNGIPLNESELCSLTCDIAYELISRIFLVVFGNFIEVLIEFFFIAFEINFS